MNAATMATFTLNPDERQFLRQHNAEGSFAKLCDLVREVYPQLRSIEVELTPDPDEEDRCKIILWVQLPKSTSMDDYHVQHGRYHDRLMSDIPLAHLPLFGVLTHFGGN